LVNWAKLRLILMLAPTSRTPSQNSTFRYYWWYTSRRKGLLLSLYGVWPDARVHVTRDEGGRDPTQGRAGG